jgi:hypothetical protein
MFCPIDYYTVSDPYPSASEEEFLLEVILVAVILGAFCVVLWKVFITNRITPRGNVLSLGLDETSATHSELYGRRIPWRTLFIYAAAGVTTFELGVSVYETVRNVQQWIANLNGPTY